MEEEVPKYVSKRRLTLHNDIFIVTEKQFSSVSEQTLKTNNHTLKHIIKLSIAELKVPRNTYNSIR